MNELYCITGKHMIKESPSSTHSAEAQPRFLISWQNLDKMGKMTKDKSKRPWKFNNGFCQWDHCDCSLSNHPWIYYISFVCTHTYTHTHTHTHTHLLIKTSLCKLQWVFPLHSSFPISNLFVLNANSGVNVCLLVLAHWLCTINHETQSSCLTNMQSAHHLSLIWRILHI